MGYDFWETRRAFRRRRNDGTDDARPTAAAVETLPVVETPPEGADRTAPKSERRDEWRFARLARATMEKRKATRSARVSFF